MADGTLTIAQVAVGLKRFLPARHAMELANQTRTMIDHIAHEKQKSHAELS
jgi:hypothetical protein